MKILSIHKYKKIHWLAYTFFSLIPVFISCKNEINQPILTTLDISDITQTSAVSGGNVTDDGDAPIFERGVCWDDSVSPTVRQIKTKEEGELGSFTSRLSGLTPQTIYYVRAYATNQVGTSYGNEVTFTTDPITVPIITTRETASIAARAAISGGNITDDGGGTILARGVCWSTTESPTLSDFKTTDGGENSLYNSYLTGLDPVTTYFIRAYASNNAGTTYGNQVSFTTTIENIIQIVFNPDVTYNSVSDANGNSYKTVKIGTQTWMAENLKTTKYNDGSNISNIIDDDSWFVSSNGAYCWYNNDISNKNIYGALYNWYAVSSQKICPIGWHIPSQEEWISLITNIGDLSVAGGRMKEVGTSHWLIPNTGATNESGFTLIPGGIREVSGTFLGLGSFGRWWKATSGNVIEVTYDSGEIQTFKDCIWRRGLSVRCLKD